MSLFKFNKLFVVLLLTFMCNGVYAKTLQVAVKLMNIEARKMSEADGDELYFSVTEYSSTAVPVISRIPHFPTYWLAKQLPAVKDVSLWEGTIKDSESVLLIFTLLEQDLPPWNSDDHIGSVQVKLTNQDGILKSKWGKPSFKDQPKIIQSEVGVPKFTLFGNNSEYALLFKVEKIK